MTQHAEPVDLAELVALAERILAACRSGARSLSTAESCTGGLIGHVITEIPGSSDVYQGGAITYSDALKRDMLRVPAELLAAHGAVSAEVCLAMAEGARGAFGTDIAVSVTGIAGPSGGSEAKPVGLTFVAVADADGTDVWRNVWAGDRSTNKLLSARAALELLAQRISA